MGDFNARIGLLSEFLSVDNFIYDQIGLIPSDVLDIDLNQSIACKISLSRSSQDRSVNRLGTRLIELCKSNELIILNGRIFSDRNIGKFTCKDLSVVDYVIISKHCINYFTDFKVNEFCPILSDVYCSIDLYMDAFQKEDVPQNMLKDKIKSWQNDKRDNFVANIDKASIARINSLLTVSNSDYDTKNNVNEAVSILSECLVSSAKKTFGTHASGAPIRAKKRCKKPWFDVNCNTKRKTFNSCKRRFIACKNEASKNEMLIAGRDYKKQLNISLIKYKRLFKKKIRKMQSKSPKDYWD